MDLTWINVVDTAIKIGFGAIITAVSGYLVLAKTQSHEERKEIKERFYRLQDEKKSKYVELLSQSQELIQCHLYTQSQPDSDKYKSYLRIFNEVQIISNDNIRIAAFNLMTDVSSFIALRKEEQETDLIDAMVKSAREKVSVFQKVAQIEVTKCYQKT
jgi:gas vesicle protein